MNTMPFIPAVTPPWFPVLAPDPPPSSAFWNSTNVRDRLKQLCDTIDLAKAMEEELEALIRIKNGKGPMEGLDGGLVENSTLYRFQDDNKIDLVAQEPLSLEASNALISRLKAQIEPFRVTIEDASGWEEKSAVVRLANKMQKSKRNKRWRKRKRKRIAELVAKEREQFDQADQEADEWRAREIAKDIAKRKVEKMKEIAKMKAKEGKKRLESELEVVLLVEKLQELRSIRIQKLKKQGHFLPEEDDKFLERIRAAVEEEERQAKAAADTGAAKDAIATAEESRKIIEGHGLESKEISGDKARNEDRHFHTTENEDQKGPDAVTGDQSGKRGPEGQSYSGVYGSISNLPVEFYHYYHGSNTDMGTLIEVRRSWDAYTRPGGSRIPGHWVQPPPPADEIWASYLVKPK